MATKEKSFNKKLYAIIVFFAVLAALIVMVAFTFKSKYIAFYPENVAKAYVETIVQTGDGYNAYKYSLVSKNMKYGDFIRENYMYPVIYRDAQGYTKGGDLDGLKGYNDESYMGEITKNDDGSKQGVVIDTMYEYYEMLMAEGWDDYDNVFTLYFEKLVEVRKSVFNDDYMTDEIMFTVLEANVRTYGQELAGAEEKRDENTGDILQKEIRGKYKNSYGDNYVMEIKMNHERDVSLEDYKKMSNAEALKTYGVSVDDISQVKCYEYLVIINEKQSAKVSVYVVKVGDSWYVDNTLTDTGDLYNIA
jgi:hypothetical protein